MKKHVLFTFLFLTGMVTFLSAQTAVTIAQARAANADGELDLIGTTVSTSGLVVSPNFRPGGLTFTLIDQGAQIGIGIFLVDSDLGYTPTIGDSIMVTGEVTQFRGLGQIEPSTITVITSGNAIPDPLVVTAQGENTESYLIRFENVSLVDPGQWSNGGSGFNVDITDGSFTTTMRIDGDVDIFGMEAPVGNFSVNGVGGQFDQDAPLTGGYQFFPRSATDIFPYNTDETEYLITSIVNARAADGDGIADLLGQKLELTGVAHGINFRPSGLQFSLIDANNNGVGVFSFSENVGYTVIEGDALKIQGTLDQFNGLTQIVPDNITIIASGNPLSQPEEVTVLDENSESSLVAITALDYIDASQWLGDGTSFNVDVTDGTNTYLVRIDADTELSTASTPSLPATIIGLGGQFDDEAPFFDGYQLLPRYAADIISTVPTEELFGAYNFTIYPNPAIDLLYYQADEDVDRLELYTTDGKFVKRGYENKVDVSDLAPGIYLIYAEINAELGVTRITKL